MPQFKKQVRNFLNNPPFKLNGAAAKPSAFKMYKNTPLKAQEDPGGQEKEKKNRTNTTYNQAWNKMSKEKQDTFGTKKDFVKKAEDWWAKQDTKKAENAENATATAAENTPKSDTAAAENLKKAAEEAKKRQETQKIRTEAEKAEEAFKKEQAAKKKATAEKKAAEEKAKAEYAKKNIKKRDRSRKKVKVDVSKDTKTGARLKTKTRTRKDGTVKTKVKETKIIGGVASKTRNVKDTRKDQRKKDRQERRSGVSRGSSVG